MAYTPLFTPATAAIGGLLLGSCASAMMVMSGRILGISGSIKGLLNGELSGWRIPFLSGYVPGSLLAVALLPASFMALPETYTLARAVTGGLLVGVGSAVGNGCTSGHGICGNARLSVRSFVYTLAFMASGAITATLTGAADALGVLPQSVQLSLPSTDEVKLGLTLLGTFLAAQGAIALASSLFKEKTSTPKRLLARASEAICGFFFPVGLAFSGMTLPAKVASFLAVTNPAWDLSLMFVMGAALLITTPIFYVTLKGSKPRASPVLTEAFAVPNNNKLDPKLLVGGVLFGCGWGVSGMCPGPALVNVAMGDPLIFAFVGAMVSGMLLSKVVDPVFEGAAGNKKAA